MKRYQQQPKSIKDIEYLFWCLKKASSQFVRNEALISLNSAMDERGIILVSDEIEAGYENEYDSEDQKMLAVQCDLACATFEVLGPASHLESLLSEQEEEELSSEAQSAPDLEWTAQSGQRIRVWVNVILFHCDVEVDGVMHEECILESAPAKYRDQGVVGRLGPIGLTAERKAVIEQKLAQNTGLKFRPVG